MRRRWARRWLDRTLADDARGRAIRRELAEEHAARAARDGEGPADGWLLRQAASVAFWSLRDRLTGRPWGPPGTPLGPGRATRDALRSLRRAPGYSAAVVVTLGAAMAATVSVFTVVRGVLLRPLPYPDPETLVRIDALHQGVSGEGGVDYPTVQDWRETLEGVGGIAVWTGAEGIYTAEGVSEVWTGTSMSPGLLETVGVRPALGSWYGPGEGGLNAPSIHLSHDLWERRFGADPGIVGRTIRMSDASWVVQGVMPRGFVWPDADTQYWIPLRDSRFLQSRGSGFLHVVARLEPGVGLDAARAELDRFTERLRAEFGDEARPVVLRRVAEVERVPVARALWTLLGAVALVLLVACANVSGLSLARTETRRGEWSVRVSLGANRRHLVAGLVAESGLLALGGGLVGLAGAFAGVRGLVALAPADLPRRSAVAIDPAVVAFAFGLSLLVGLLAGLLPGLRAARSAAPEARRGGGPDRRAHRTHAALAAAQIALSVVLLMGAGTLLHSFVRLAATDTGFRDPGRLLVAEIGLTDDRYPDLAAILDYQDRLLEGVSAVPGVEASGLTSHLPFSGSRLEAAMVLGGEVFERGRTPVIGIEVWNGGYREALGLPLLRGRDPRRDPAGETPVREVVLNEAAATRLAPGGEALGLRLSFDVEPGQPSAPGTFYEVVGIVPDVRAGSLEQAPAPRAYYDIREFRRAYGFVSGRYFYAVFRTRGPASALAPAVRDIALELDPRVPVRSLASLESLVRRTTLPARFRTLTLGLFAVLAVAVALLGVYGVMAYSVATGLRRIGIEKALGAPAGAVGRRVVLRAATIAAGGAALGAGAALILAPALESMVYEVPARDPWTLVGVLTLVAGGAVAAALRPARRAARVDPARILRET